MIALAEHDPLTPTERQVVRLVSLGCSVRQVAAILGRSYRSADNHKSRAMKKLAAHNLATLTRRALELNVSPLGDALTAEELRAACGVAQRSRGVRAGAAAPD